MDFVFLSSVLELVGRKAGDMELFYGLADRFYCATNNTTKSFAVAGLVEVIPDILSALDRLPPKPRLVAERNMSIVARSCCLLFDDPSLEALFFQG